MIDSDKTATLTISVRGTDGSRPAVDVMPAITIIIPKQISARVAKMHVLEYVLKELKGKGLADALKAIGCK